MRWSPRSAIGILLGGVSLLAQTDAPPAQTTLSAIYGRHSEVPSFILQLLHTRDRLPPCRPHQFFLDTIVCNRLANHGEAFATHAMTVAAVRQLSLGSH